MEEFVLAFSNLENAVKSDVFYDGGVLEAFMELSYNMIKAKLPYVHDEYNCTLEHIKKDIRLAEYNENIQICIIELFASWSKWCSSYPYEKYSLTV